MKKLNNKKNIVVAFVIATGEKVVSVTNNAEQRIREIKYNIKSANGNGKADFDRFKIFVGCKLEDIKFKVYKHDYTLSFND